MVQLFGTLENIAWFLTFAGQLVLLWRLWRTGLITRYRWFAVFLVVDAAQTGVLFFLDRTTNAYGYAYLAFVPVRLVVALLVVLELYSLVLASYAGIGSLGRWVVTGGLIASFVIATISSGADLAGATSLYPILLYFSVLERVAMSGLLLFLLIITGFLVWFPVPLSKNTVRHTILLATLFCVIAVIHLCRNVLGSDLIVVMTLGALQMLVEAGCLVAWILLFRTEGEARTVVVGHQWRPAENVRLTAQLGSINAALVRTARK